jgi:hypothetical protein
MHVRITAMKCEYCGSENPDYAFYCGSCAKELARSSTAGTTNQLPTKQDGRRISFILHVCSAHIGLVGFVLGLVAVIFRTTNEGLSTGLILIALLLIAV